MTRLINEIASLMNEMDDVGMAPGMSGGFMGTQETTPLLTLNQLPGNYRQEGEEEFNEEDLQLAKQFIEQIGSVDLARELLDKVGECEDCLGLIGNDSDEESISMMATMVPDDVDMATGGF